MSSVPESEFWVLCPVCHKPNPAGTSFCKHCWGAALGARKPVSREELEKMLRQREKHLRRRRRALWISVAAASLIVVALVTLPILANYTDVLAPPPKALNSNSRPGEWAMFRYDSSNSGSAAPSAIAPAGTLKWVFTAGEAIRSSAAVANGVVYFGCRDGKLYALDAETGAKLWDFETGSRVESSPAVVDGRVFFGSNDGYLYALDVDTGTELWKFKTRYPIVSSPAVANGMVFFGADDYYVYALDAVRGTKLWQFDARGPVESSPVVSEGKLYVASGAQWVYVLNAGNGRPRLRFRVTDSAYGTPAIVGDTAMVSDFRGNLYIIDGKARNWPLEYELKPYWIQLYYMWLAPPPPLQSGFIWGLRIGRPVTSSPVVRGDNLFIGVDRNLIAVDLKNRKIAWTFKTGGTVRSTAALVGNTLLVGSQDGRLYAVDSTTGQKVWDFSTGDQITASPTVADGVVYIGSHDGKFYAIR